MSDTLDRSKALADATDEELFAELALRDVAILVRIQNFETDPKYTVWWNRQLSKNIATNLLIEAGEMLEQD